MPNEPTINEAARTHGDADSNGAEAKHTNGARRKLSAEELTRIFREQTQDKSALVSEPRDTGFWPTAGLSDNQLDWISEALGKVPRSALANNKVAT
jgi:hypothetical protein